MRNCNVLVFLVLLLSVIVSSKIDIKNCEYIDNDTKWVRLLCHEGFDFPRNPCFKDLFVNDSKEINRSKVKLLNFRKKTTEFHCDYPYIGQLYRIFGNIRILDLSYTGMPEQLINRDLKFDHLETFNASHNDLMFLTKTIFQYQPNLKIIDFSYNFIMEIDDATFDQNKKLSEINLSHNSLSSLNKVVFSDLRELKIVDLSFNQIEVIDLDAFRNNKKLKILRLFNNPLSRFDCNSFAPLKNLRLIEANLENINELDLSCAGLSFIESVAEIVISLPGVENKIKCPKSQLKQLHRFSIAGHQLQSTKEVLALLGTPLENLDLSSNHLGVVDSNTFEQFENLKHLKLSRSNVSGLNDNVFQHQQLVELDISYNDLKNVNFDSLSKTLGLLSSLSIAGGQLNDVRKVLRLLTPSLKSLDISSNYVGPLEMDIFQHLNNLHFLNLSDTLLRNFTFSNFHQSQLKSLDISSNFMRFVDFSLFARRFNDLKVLNLERNGFYSGLETITQQIFPKLELLGISKNDFSCKNLANFIEKMPKLRFIHNPSSDKHIDGVDCVEQNGGGGGEEGKPTK